MFGRRTNRDYVGDKSRRQSHLEQYLFKRHNHVNQRNTSMSDRVIFGGDAAWITPASHRGQAQPDTSRACG